jgi:hypothetical protein
MQNRLCRGFFLAFRGRTDLHTMMLPGCLLLLATVATADNVYSCHTVNMSLVSSFCAPHVKEPKACVDAAGFNYHRDEAGYKKMTLECDSEHKKKKQCPNQPSECTHQVSVALHFLSKYLF